MESFPFRLLLIMVLVTFAVTTSLFLVSVLGSSFEERLMSDSVNNIILTMQTLRAGDVGSFDFVNVHIPAGRLVEIDSATDTLRVNGASYGLPGDVHGSLLLGPGDYELRVYYGEFSGELTLSFT